MAVCPRRARARPPVGEEDERGEGLGGLGQLLGHTVLGLWAEGRRQVSFSPDLFLFSIFLTFVWFNKNTKPFYFLMPIFIEASYIITELLNKWHNFWTILYIYNNIYPKQIITALIPNAQNKYL